MIVDDYMLNEVLEKIKEIIGIDKFNDSKILINTYDELPNDITLTIFVVNDVCY